MLKIAYWISMLMFAVLFGITFFGGLPQFRVDIIFFAVLCTIIYRSRDLLNLNAPIYSLFALGLIPHSLGIYGFYGSSPLPFAWDHFTHFFGMIPVAMLIFQAFSKQFDWNFFTSKNLGLLLAIFLLASGVGALLEITEFVGFLALGVGDGALRFGDGDSFAIAMVTAADDQKFEEMINVVGGGWINEGWDFIYNSLGFLVGITLMSLIRWLCIADSCYPSKKS